MAKKQRKKSTFWDDFKKFITKGNVIDMAVAVVIGGAFGKITTGLVNYIITPLTSLFLGEIDLTGVKTVLVAEVLNEAGEVVTPEVSILWGQWLQTIIDFLIIALCIFVVIKAITSMRERAEKLLKKKEEERLKKYQREEERKRKKEEQLREQEEKRRKKKLASEISILTR